VKIQTNNVLSGIVATGIAVAAISFGSVATTPVAAASAPDGQALYNSKCSSCHKADGSGGGPFPALAGNKDVENKNPATIITVTKYGKKIMPAYGSQLSNAEIAAVLTYVRSSWGNKAPAVTAKQVANAPTPAPQ
jgi:mono/diheme cytochrome c family protein